FRWTRNGLIAGALIFSINSCSSKGGGDVVLPPIGGYANSNAVAMANLQAHWTFDGTQKEDKSGAGPAQVVGASYVPGIKGQGVKLNNGYLYYTGITGLTSVTTSFTVSTWMQVDNNKPLVGGGFPYQAFQYVRANPSADPNNPFGNINLTIEAGQFFHTPAAGYDTLIIHPTFRDPAGGLQDNVNNYPLNLIKDSSGKWLHVLIDYNASTHLFQTWANGVKVSNFEDRGAVNVYTPSPSTSAVIGAWISNVTGIGVNVQGFTIPFVGAIDEVRVYNKALTDAEISALYQLEKAGR
ncbi:MAG: LamG-like jellyroll fold domain-containing protein, partial [Ginsengibacter sp.]